MSVLSEVGRTVATAECTLYTERLSRVCVLCCLVWSLRCNCVRDVRLWQVERAQAKTVGASVAGMFRNKSDAKHRALTLAHLSYEPDETFLAEAFEDDECTTLQEARLLVQCYHTKVAERGNTEPVGYNAAGVRWLDQSIRMGTSGTACLTRRWDSAGNNCGLHISIALFLVACARCATV